MYDLALAWRDAGLADFHPDVRAIPYNYPAAFAIAFVPFTFVSPEVGRLVWFTIAVASLVGAAYVLVGTLLRLPLVQRLAVASGLSVLMALFQPARASLYQGQIDTVLLLFIALSFSAFIRGRAHQAGWWMALAVTVKPFLGFLVLFFLWKRSYRAAISACIWGAVLLFGPLLILGPGVLFDFLEVAAYWSSPEFLVV